MQSKNSESLIERNTTHGMSKTRLYRIFRGMISRCKYETASGYDCYGGRGIAVCDEWRNDFQAFHDWATHNGYDDNLTIERMDANGNYEPSNCCWITKAQQNNNTRRSHYITHDGKTQTVSEWAAELGIPQHTVRCRLNAGWEDMRALTQPVGIIDNHGEKNPSAKLKESDVREILAKIASDCRLAQIAEEYNVSYSTIRDIRSGKSWSAAI